MNSRILSRVILLPFLALTGWAMLEVGIMGIVNTYQSPGGLQVFVDLIIALLLLLILLVPHAKAHGRNPWVWVALTLGLGSISPLLYFATAKSDAAHLQG